jgi:hypothetical protein
MKPIECSETSAFNIQTPGKYPEDNVPYLQHGESLKTTKLKFIDVIHSTCFRHHYAHHQEYSKGRQTAYGVLHWSCRVDLRRWSGSHVHLMAVVIRLVTTARLYALDGCGYTSRITTAVRRTQDPPHLLKSTLHDRCRTLYAVCRPLL